MKALIYSMLAFVAGITFVSCDNDNENDPKDDSVFLFSASVNVIFGDNEQGAEEQKSVALNALKSVGFSADKLTMEYSGIESDAVNVLNDKMAQVEQEVQSNMNDGIINVGVKGAKKNNYTTENDKKHTIRQWYSKEFRHNFVGGSAPGSTGLSKTGHDFYWVKFIRSEETSYYPIGYYEDDYYTQFGTDTNLDAGGDYIYLILEHSGKRNNSPENDQEFKWESQYENTYITDVIGIYGGGEPQSIRIDGRTYKKMNRVADLNKKASGEYVWLYATTDPMPGYQGYYLNTGAADYTYDLPGCRMLTLKKDFVANNYLNTPNTYRGHRIVERVVQAYSTKGKPMGELDTNYGQHDEKSCYYERLVLTYASKSANY